MPTQVTNYQCPACTGPLHFVGASGKLECDYCGSTYDVAEIEALIARRAGAKKDKNWAEADRIRDVLKAMGVEIKDTPAGVEWKRI